MGHVALCTPVFASGQTAHQLQQIESAPAPLGQLSSWLMAAHVVFATLQAISMLTTDLPNCVSSRAHPSHPSAWSRRHRSRNRRSCMRALPAAGCGVLCLPQPQGPWGRWRRGPSPPPPSGAQRGRPLYGPPFHHCRNNAERPHLRHDHLRLWIRYEAAGHRFCITFWDSSVFAIFWYFLARCSLDCVFVVKPS